MAKKTYFVTGTDTGVGKTVVSAAILEAARILGKRTLAMKPIASGCDETPEGLRNEDALMLQAAMTEALPYDQVNPIALLPAIAPHVAAQEAGLTFNSERLVGFCRGMQLKPGDMLLVEGAGGWRVPLNDRETYARVPQALGCPVILVVPLRLGCINHALLTVEAILRDGVKLAGWVANRPVAEVMASEAETLAYLKSHLPAPCLGVLPWLDAVDPKALAQQLSIESLFEI